MPLFLESFKKSKDLKKAARKFNSLKKEVIEEYKKRAINPNSEINKKIKKLFCLSIKIAENKEILEKAYFRTLKGNPPKKTDKSFGDAIIWEMILENYKNDDLVIISGDGDYSEKYNKTELHGYLRREWDSKSKKTIKLYTNLGIFVNEKSGKRKPVKKEAIQEEDYLNIFSSNINAISPTIITSSALSKIININASHILNTERTGILNNLSVNSLRSICSSCGKSFEYNTSITGMGYHGECPDCRNKISTETDTLTTPYEKCTKCGELYYKGTTCLDNLLENKCTKCFNK